MEKEKYTKLNLAMPWTITLIFMGLLCVIGYKYQAIRNPLESNIKKINLISNMRIHILKAVENEKSAVLAETDEDSIKFANEARNAIDAVEAWRKEIAEITHHENISNEIKLINEFNSYWAQYRKLDEIILDLAVQNTNLKAEELSLNSGAKAIEKFEENFKTFIVENSKDSQNCQIINSSYEALVFGLKSYMLHRIHIKEAKDEGMDRIEKQINYYDKSLRNTFHMLSDIGTLNGREKLKAAMSAYDTFMKVTEAVLKLSRENTNIKSMELSLGKKRIVSAQCIEILTNIQNEMQNRVVISIK